MACRESIGIDEVIIQSIRLGWKFGSHLGILEEFQLFYPNSIRLVVSLRVLISYGRGKFLSPERLEVRFKLLTSLLHHMKCQGWVDQVYEYSSYEVLKGTSFALSILKRIGCIPMDLKGGIPLIVVVGSIIRPWFCYLRMPHQLYSNVMCFWWVYTLRNLVLRGF